MIDLERLVRPNVRTLTPYSCARDEFEGKDGIFLDANENPFGKMNRYPDPYQKELKKAVSRIKGVPEENIFLGNGSDEIIDLCFRIFCNPGSDSALTFSPTYGMYSVSASANDIRMISLPLDKDFNIIYEDVLPWLSIQNLKLILICSPNNPTGNCMKKDVIEKIISGFNGIVLLDEAYNDFADEPSFNNSIGKYPNLIVMQTFSKAWGMASVRIGMAFASREIIHYFNKMKPPYNISTINQKAVLKNITDQTRFNEEVRKIKKERERLSSELKKIAAVKEIYASDANFVLVKVTDALLIYNYLVANGIIVRNRSRVVNNCLRITVGTRAENTKLIKSLKTINI